MTATRDGIIKLLEKSQDLSLLDVVCNEYFQPAIRNLVPELIDYLFSKKIIHQIFDVLLTNKSLKEILFEGKPLSISSSTETQNPIPSDRDLKNIEYLFAKLLTANIEIIKSSLCENTEVCNYINEFIQNSSLSSDCRISGIFSRILRQLIYSTDGNYIEKIPNLFNFLLDKISILSYGKILKSIVKKFPTKFNIPLDQIIESILLESINPEKTLFCLNLVQSLFQKPEYVRIFLDSVAKIEHMRIVLTIAICLNSEKPNYPTISHSIQEKIMANLANKFYTWPNRLSIISSLTILQKVYKNIDQIKDFIQRQQILSLIVSSQSYFASIIDPRDYRQSLLVTLYPHRIKMKMADNLSLIVHFMLGQTSTFVSNSIIEYIREMDDSAFHNFVEDKEISIVDLVIKFCTENKSKINGHIYELAKLLSERNKISRVLQTPKWLKFTEKYLNPHIELLNIVYKYDVNSDDSDIDNNSDQSQTFIENFDFYSPYISSTSQTTASSFSEGLPTLFSESHQKIIKVIGSNAFSRPADAYKNSDEYSGSASESEDETKSSPVNTISTTNEYSGSASSGEEIIEIIEERQNIEIDSPLQPIDSGQLNLTKPENEVTEPLNLINDTILTSEEDSETDKFTISDEFDDENSKSSTSTSTTSQIKTKKNVSLSWDSRYLTMNWEMENSSDPNSDKLETAELQEIKMKTQKNEKRMNTHSGSFDHGCANAKSDFRYQEKIPPLIGNEKVPTFGITTSLGPSLKIRRSRKHPHENASISDLPESLRKPQTT